MSRTSAAWLCFVVAVGCGDHKDSEGENGGSGDNGADDGGLHASPETCYVQTSKADCEGVSPHEDSTRGDECFWTDVVPVHVDDNGTCVLNLPDVTSKCIYEPNIDDDIGCELLECPGDDRNAFVRLHPSFGIEVIVSKDFTDPCHPPVEDRGWVPCKGPEDPVPECRCACEIEL